MSRIPPKDVSVISASDYLRIRTYAQKTPAVIAAERQQEKQQRRREMHDHSLARTKNWKDSVMALRERKEQKRKEKFDREEEGRVKLDQEEDRLKAKQRADSLNRAIHLMQQEDERVREFNAKLHLAEVLGERERQIGIERTLRRQEAERDQTFHEDMMAELAVARQQLQEQQALQRERARQLREDRAAQLQDSLSRTLAEKQSELAEGSILQERAHAQLIEEQEKVLAARADAIRVRRENDQHNDVLKARFAEERQRAAAEEERAQRQAARKDALNESVARRDAELRRRREDQQAQLVERLAVKQRDVALQQEGLIERQYMESMTVKDREETAKEDARRRILERTLRVREAQIREKRAQQTEAEADAQHTQTLRRNLAQLCLEDEREYLEQRRRNREIAEFQLRQAEQARQRARADQEDQMGTTQTRGINEEDAWYDRYTEGELAKAAAKGLDLRPMIVEVNKQQRRAVKPSS
eukprot:gnl/Trimastix_PCT/1747.p1 GENE.gnl/Trimastix_PCT/1747~~gnl/Trimastix_PCT/1747.p1  ORF type:complete len:474 (-),score=188.62 gnl/Trimastix_PCT/1747:132-1553(-)